MTGEDSIEHSGMRAFTFARSIAYRVIASAISLLRAIYFMPSLRRIYSRKVSPAIRDAAIAIDADDADALFFPDEFTL